MHLRLAAYLDRFRESAEHLVFIAQPVQRDLGRSVIFIELDHAVTTALSQADFHGVDCFGQLVASGIGVPDGKDVNRMAGIVVKGTDT